MKSFWCLLSRNPKSSCVVGVGENCETPVIAAFNSCPDSGWSVLPRVIDREAGESWCG